MRIEIYCPVCGAAGIKRKLLEVDADARGVIWPWCKGCHKNVKIVLGEDDPSKEKETE